MTQLLLSIEITLVLGILFGPGFFEFIPVGFPDLVYMGGTCFRILGCFFRMVLHVLLFEFVPDPVHLGDFSCLLWGFNGGVFVVLVGRRRRRTR